MVIYDEIGRSYTEHRSADSRIVDKTVRLLNINAGSLIADIGAGTGNYSVALAERGFLVKAIEPSDVMREQAAGHPDVEHLNGSAEKVPLPDSCADGVICILAFHHFTDPLRAAREMARICADGPIVLFTFDPREGEMLWFEDYFPFIWDQAFELFPPLAEVNHLFQEESEREVKSYIFELPPDLEDHFAAAGWKRPEIYLDAAYRMSMSAFALADQAMVSEVIKNLENDLNNGVWDNKYGYLRKQDKADLGYRFIHALPRKAK